MKIMRKAALLFSLLALAGAGAHAQNSTSTNITLNADVDSFDNITCTQSSGGLTFSSITSSGATSPQAVNCSVTSNDSTAVDVLAYLPAASPLTGTNTSSTLPSTDILWSATEGGTYTAFANLTGSYASDVGAQVATSVAQGTNTAVNFYLELNVPATQVPDTYTGTMTVAIIPGS